MNPDLDNFAVVLCRVEGSMNVGAACRAMKTMGVARLVLADCPAYDEVEVRMHALLAFDLYGSALRYSSLREALGGFSLVAGFTRRLGQRRKENLAVEDFAAGLAGRGAGKVALVFGNERDGLSDDELALCDLAVGIDSAPSFPSLNLSHAVQIACWELRRRQRDPSGRGHESSDSGREVVGQGDEAPGRGSVAGGRGSGAAGREAFEAAARDIADALQRAGLYKIAGRAEAEIFIRSVAARAGLSGRELERFKAMFIKLGALSTFRT